MGRATELRLTGALLVVAALAWVITANRMVGMDMGPGTDLGGLGWFTGVWAVMMAAMMLPSLVPMAGAYADEGRPGGTALFVAGYLGLWVIAAAALYELTPLKARCLRHCRDGRLLIADWRRGPAGALRMGLEQGGYCIGSSWALMAALFALGVMSITWMVVIAASIAIEKLLPRPRLASGAAAALLLSLAAGVAFFPEQLPGLTIPG